MKIAVVSWQTFDLKLVAQKIRQLSHVFLYPNPRQSEKKFLRARYLLTHSLNPILHGGGGGRGGRRIPPLLTLVLNSVAGIQAIVLIFGDFS